MPNQLFFAIILFITITVFAYTLRKIYRRFSITQKTPPLTQWAKRIKLCLKVAVGQTKILRKPLVGLMHALVFWGFVVISIGTLEMILDGLLAKEHVFSNLGQFYLLISASGDIFAYLVFLFIVLFLARRVFLKLKRFQGRELKPKNKFDAVLSLCLIGLLMVSLMGMNIFYLSLHGASGNYSYPISKLLYNSIPFSEELNAQLYGLAWWMHILLIFFFANYLPYSKHFHVFLSLPNVLLSSIEPLTKLPAMPSVTKEVQIMLGETAAEDETPPQRFGVKDVEDVTWKNYLDALTCTECGRCTESCPANITGKKLSPRKIFVNLRQRMKEKGENYFKDKNYKDDKSLSSSDLISYEELWACTTCNACAQECPLNISHPNLIVDMRRYLVMEEGKAPQGVNRMFANMENNGSPWQFSPDDRLEWTQKK